MKRMPTALLTCLLALVATSAAAQLDARMMRYPDVSASHITFVYAGDIWVVQKAGGLATRLSSPAGEETWPRFSPDGSRIAFSANYDGNTDVYVVPTQGGDPVRLTHHPSEDRVVDWHPDGRRVLFASGRESGRHARRLHRRSHAHPPGGHRQRVDEGDVRQQAPASTRFPSTSAPPGSVR